LIIKAIQVVYGRTVQLAPFQSYHGEVTITADLEEMEQPSTAIKQLTETAKAAVRKEAISLQEQYRAKQQNGE